MKVIQYTFIFLAAICVVVVAALELFIVLALLQDGTSRKQAQGFDEFAVVPPATTPFFTSSNLFVSTNVATPAPRRTPVPTLAPIGPAAEATTPSPVILAAATPVVRSATANRGTELYSGPGVDFAIVGSVAANQSLSIVMTSQDGVWYQLADGGWIGAYVVDSLLSSDLAQASTITDSQSAVSPQSVGAALHTVSLPVATSPGTAAVTVMNPSVPTYAPIQATGLTYPQICVVDESRMTDLQIAAFAGQFVGQTFTDWPAWVYDVENQDGRYDLSLSMEGPRFLWQRNIVVENIPPDLAFTLAVEQQVLLSGRIVRNETMDGLCNPLVVDSYVFRTPQNIRPTPILSSTDVPSLAPTLTPAMTFPPTAMPIYQWSVGQDVMVGNVRWKILSAENLNNRLKGENLFIEVKTTPGKFIKVSFEMENRGIDPLSYTGMELVDHQGRTFVDYEEGHAYVAGNERCAVIEKLEPNRPKYCTVIFEVAADAVGLQARVNDLEIFDNDVAVIDLRF